MLKRFLKFLKGAEEEALPEFEGSYLDYLLSDIEPGVQVELDKCKEHDPLLLVIAEILRVSMKGTWSASLRQPLLDQHSPLKSTQKTATTPPPPPPSSDAPATKEIELFDDDELEVLEEGFLEEESSGDEEERSEVDLVEESDGEHSTNEIDDDEEPERASVYDADTAVVSDPSILEQFQDDSFEDEDTGAEDESAGESEDFGSDDLPRVDKKEVLQAGRVFLGMLIENDRLPLDLQLGIEETLLARDLLVGYFVGHQDFEAKAQKLLRIVEEKFRDGQFSQARILLQLFQTDKDTRIRNDRNIFYEDMIQRLGIRRRHPISANLVEVFEGLTRSEDEDVDIPGLFDWLGEHLFVKMHLFLRDKSAVDTWEAVGQKSSLPGASENLLRFLPPRRWRHLDLSDEELEVLLREHINADTLSNYVINQMKTCYFVLRAVGDTGLEGYLDTFFDWTEKNFEVNSTLLFPELYRRSMGDIDMMRAVFQDLYVRYFKREVEAKALKLNDEELSAAIRGGIERIRSVNVNDVPPGNYDFGSFVFDHIFDVEYPTKEFAFKVHRLT